VASPLLAVGSLLWLGRVLLAETPRPPIGVYIAVLAALAVVVTIWPPESNLGKAAWLAAFFALTGLEIATLYQERTENQKQQAEARRKEAEAFQSIADGITASMTSNQSAFDATMRRMRGLAQLSKEDISEATGEDSFCYVDMGGWGSSQGVLIANIVQKGRYPLSHVDVAITDLEALHEALKSGNIGDARRGFPTIDFLTRVSLWRPLATYSIDATVDSRSFNIEMFARNGAFTELFRIRRLKEGGFATAKIVSASYFTNKRGIVLEKIDKSFPAEALKNDKDWSNFKKLKKITIQE
jgi:hypothetical protein